jgi:O-antigen/teichoic acid export membrane protein
MKIAKTSGERRVAGTMLGLAFWTIVSQACGVSVLLMFANSLSTADFGKLSGAMFLQQFFSTISVSGFRSIVIREIVKRPQDHNLIAGSYLFLSALLGGLILLGTLIIVLLLPLGMDERMAYGLIAFGHIGACLIPNALYDASQSQVRGAGLAAIVEVFATLAIVICFCVGAITIPVAASLVTGKWIVTAIAGLADYGRRQDNFRPRVDRHQVRSLWSSARLMSVATTLNVAPAALGVPLTRALFGAGEAGLLAIAVFVFRTHALVTGLLTRTVFPHVAGTFGETQSFIRRMALAYGSLTLFLTTMAVIGSEIMLRFFLPPEYLAARWTIALILVAATIRVGGVAGNLYLIARYRERTLLAISMTGMTVFAISLMLPLNMDGRNQTAIAILTASILMAGSLLMINTRQSTDKAISDTDGDFGETLD